MKCSKCNGEMEEGIIGDKSTNLNAPFNPSWGTVIKKGIMGSEFGQRLENEHNVHTFRCKTCGYLESYAK